jgi:hypothetical protein
LDRTMHEVLGFLLLAYAALEDVLRLRQLLAY